jgi:hypothetical protein
MRDLLLVAVAALAAAGGAFAASSWRRLPADRYSIEVANRSAFSTTALRLDRVTGEVCLFVAVIPKEREEEIRVLKLACAGA